MSDKVALVNKNLISKLERQHTQPKLIKLGNKVIKDRNTRKRMKKLKQVLKVHLNLGTIKKRIPY